MERGPQASRQGRQAQRRGCEGGVRDAEGLRSGRAHHAGDLHLVRSPPDDHREHLSDQEREAGEGEAVRDGAQAGVARAVARPPMPAVVPMLRLANVEVVYDDVILVLKGLSLEVRKGQVVALLGSYGSGKSTTLKACPRLL